MRMVADKKRTEYMTHFPFINTITDSDDNYAGLEVIGMDFESKTGKFYIDWYNAVYRCVSNHTGFTYTSEIDINEFDCDLRYLILDGCFLQIEYSENGIPMYIPKGSNMTWEELKANVKSYKNAQSK